MTDAANPFRNALGEWLEEETLFLGSSAGEFDRAIIGFSRRDDTVILVYDIDRILECLMDDDMDRESAEEWYDYNIASAYMGVGTPMYIHTTRALGLAPDASMG